MEPPWFIWLLAIAACLAWTPFLFLPGTPDFFLALGGLAMKKLLAVLYMIRHPAQTFNWMVNGGN
jgi:hypothetical protein